MNPQSKYNSILFRLRPSAGTRTAPRGYRFSRLHGPLGYMGNAVGIITPKRFEFEESPNPLQREASSNRGKLCCPLTKISISHYSVLG